VLAPAEVRTGNALVVQGAAQCAGLALGLVWVLISHVARVQANRVVVLVNAVQQAANDGPRHGQPVMGNGRQGVLAADGQGRPHVMTRLLFTSTSSSRYWPDAGRRGSRYDGLARECAGN